MGNTVSAPEPEEHKKSFQQIRNVLAADTETFKGGNFTSEAPYDVNKINQPYYKEYMEAKNKYLAIKNFQKGGAIPGSVYNRMDVQVKNNEGGKTLEYDQNILQAMIPGKYTIVPVVSSGLQMPVNPNPVCNCNCKMCEELKQSSILASSSIPPDQQYLYE